MGLGVVPCREVYMEVCVDDIAEFAGLEILVSWTQVLQVLFQAQGCLERFVGSACGAKLALMPWVKEERPGP